MQWQVKKAGMAPLRYVDDDGAVTEKYPLNPTGSPEGIASLSSPGPRLASLFSRPQPPTIPASRPPGYALYPSVQQQKSAKEGSGLLARAVAF